MTNATERMNAGETQCSMQTKNLVGRSECCRARDENDAEEVYRRNCVTEREGEGENTPELLQPA